MLARLEEQILELHNGLSLRPTLVVAAQIGELLIQAKSEVAHGQWLPWVKRLGMSARTVEVYIQVAKSQNSADFDEHISISGFLTAMRVAKRQARIQQRHDETEAAIAAIGEINEQYRVLNTDNRKFTFPKQIDCIATDPPWCEMKHYQWLSNFASAHLREGGSLLVQCGTADLSNVLAILSERLNYVWTLAIVYQQSFAMLHLPLAISWRPVLLFSKGPWQYRDLFRVSDTLTVGLGPSAKRYFDWEQPLEPWIKWISCLTRPGELVVDPFCGVGTLGEATKLAGGRKFLGTEIDEKRAQSHRAE